MEIRKIKLDGREQEVTYLFTVSNTGIHIVTTDHRDGLAMHSIRACADVLEYETIEGCIIPPVVQEAEKTKPLVFTNFNEMQEMAHYLPLGTPLYLGYMSENHITFEVGEAALKRAEEQHRAECFDSID